MMQAQGEKPAGGLGHVRRHNRSLILSALRAEDALSRVELANAVGLTLPTVSRLVDDLAAAGLVEDTGASRTTGGRKASLYRLHSSGGVVLGVDLSRRPRSGEPADSPGRRIVAIDLKANVVAAADIGEGDRPEDDIRFLIEAAGPVLLELRESGRTILGMGIGVPGPLDVRHSVVIEPAALPGWPYVTLRDQLSALLGFPVFVENNVNAAAYGEFFLHHQSARSLVYVMAAVGVGAGIVLDRMPYRGRADNVGEIGHCTPTGDTSVECSCGRRGCLEAIASTGAIVDFVRETRPDLRTFDEVIRAERQGDDRARHGLARGGRALGIGLATLFNIMDPELLVIGGAAVASDTYFDNAIDEMRTRTLIWDPDEVRVERTQQTSDVVAHGAATLALQEIVFASPFQRSAS